MCLGLISLCLLHSSTQLFHTSKWAGFYKLSNRLHQEHSKILILSSCHRGKTPKQLYYIARVTEKQLSK